MARPTTRLRVFLAGMIVLGTIAIWHAEALACSCASGYSARELIRASDAAVIAKLVDVTIPHEGDPRYGGDEQADFRYRVKRVYKGRHRLERGEILTIRSSTSGASCGLPKREDRDYGLLLERRARGWQAGLCSLISPERLRRAGERLGTRSSGSTRC